MTKRLIIFLVGNAIGVLGLRLILNDPGLYSPKNTAVILTVIGVVGYLGFAVIILKGLKWKSRRSFVRIISGIIFASGIIALLNEAAIVPDLIYMPFGYFLMLSNMSTFPLLLALNIDSVLINMLIIYFETVLLIYTAITILHYNDFRIDKLKK